MKKRFLITLFFGVISFVLFACSGGQPEEVTPVPVTFKVDMKEYSYTPNKIEVKVGQEVTIEMINNGVLSHELMIGRDVIMTDGRPNGYTIDLFESTGVEPMIMPESAGVMNMGEAMDMESSDEHMDDEAMQMEGDDQHMDDKAMQIEGDDEHMQGDDEHMDDGHMDHMGTMVLLEESGDEASITFVVTEDMIGEWEIGCFELDGVHYQSGMTGIFVVTEN